MKSMPLQKNTVFQLAAEVSWPHGYLRRELIISRLLLNGAITKLIMRNMWSF
jgi:hypothetical protein